MSARIVAALAAMSEFVTARMTVGLLAASTNQLSVNPAGGQAWMRLVLNA